MADFKIKSTAGTGNKTLIQSQDQSGSAYAIEVGTAGALRLGTITAGTFPEGHVVQTRQYSTSTYATGTVTASGLDDSIPQIGEGLEIMTLAITPLSALNYLIITASWFGSNASDGNPSFALHQDSIADAIAAWRTTSSATTANKLGHCSFIHKEPCSSTTARTYKVRHGGASAAAIYFLGGEPSGRRLGGAGKGTMIIQEIQV